MDHAATTKINDAGTNRQFNRFLATAQLPSIWKGRVKVLADVLQMPLILQDRGGEIPCPTKFLAEVEKGGAEVNRVYLCIQPHETP